MFQKVAHTHSEASFVHQSRGGVPWLHLRPEDDFDLPAILAPILKKGFQHLVYGA
jgi:hypothetical protein